MNVKSIKFFPAAAALLISISLAGCSVMRGESSVPEYTNDAAITTAVSTKLARTDEVSLTRVHVETDHGVVMLSGFVKNNAQRLAAERAAQSVHGVKGVTNNLVISPRKR